MIPKHEIIEQNGHRVYSRAEEGGSTRLLKVWSKEGCIKKLRDKAQHEGEAALQAMFNAITEQYVGYLNGADPMFAEWFAECYEEMERAYYEVQGAEPIEEFGSDELEEFGV